MPEVSSEYRKAGEWVLIDMRLNRMAQLFNSFDPAPFHERDLDDDAESYIVACARELAPHRRFRLVIELPADEAAHADAQQIERAIQHYFSYRAQGQKRELRHVFRHGRWSLMVGSACLLSCLGLRALLGWLTGGHGSLAVDVANEGLLIIGWVAMWRPAEMFLYAWHPTRQTLRVYEHLSHVPVDVLVRHDKPASV